MSRSTEKRPNLIYVFADQLRYQSCGYAGDTRARTPNIDQFATWRARISAMLFLVVRCVPPTVLLSSPENTPVAPAWQLMNSE